MKFDTGARHLYERLGFRVEREEKDAFRMRAEAGEGVQGPGAVSRRLQITVQGDCA